jgi:hypothetical protein
MIATAIGGGAGVPVCGRPATLQLGSRRSALRPRTHPTSAARWDQDAARARMEKHIVGTDDVIRA